MRSLIEINMVREFLKDGEEHLNVVYLARVFLICIWRLFFRALSSRLKPYLFHLFRATLDGVNEA